MENWLITDGELLTSKTYQIHDIVNNPQKDYREKAFINSWTRISCGIPNSIHG